jgi:hypothetical protein
LAAHFIESAEPKAPVPPKTAIFIFLSVIVMLVW